MHLVSNETTLVIAGAWNQAILTPAWVLQHGLKKTIDGGNQVKAFLPTGLGGVFEFPRYVIHDLSYVVRPDLLILSPSDSTPYDLGALEDVASNMLEQLPHTPVTGIGHNFEFRENNLESINLDVFTASRQDIADLAPIDWEPATSVISSSFKNNSETVIVTITRQFEANEIAVKFNFHHPTKSVKDALTILKGENDYVRMEKNLELAKTMIDQLYTIN